MFFRLMLKIFILTIVIINWFYNLIFMRYVRKITSYDSILLNVTSGVGDAVMAIPLLFRIHEIFPKADIILLINRSTKTIFQALSFHCDLHCIEDYEHIQGYIRLIFSIRKKQLSIYFGALPSNTIKMMLLPYLAKTSFRIKHQSPHRGSNNFDFLFHHLESIPENRHRIDCNLDLLKVFIQNVTVEIRKPLIDIPKDTKISIYNLLFKSGYNSDKPMMAIHPGCNPKALTKRWPSQNYVELINDIQKQYDIQLLIIGGHDEIGEIAYIQNLLNSSPLNLAGQLNLIETAAAISFCRFLVSNDSGIMHLAAAVDIPVFAIFGPTNDKHIGPYGMKHSVIRNGTDVNQVSIEQVIRVLENSEFGLKHVIKSGPISQSTQTHQ